jgi:hypothetical protein
MPVLTEMTHLSKILQVPLSSMVITVAMAMMTRVSSSSLWGTEPPPKKAHFGALLRVSSQYVCGVVYPLRSFHSSYLCS